MLHKNVHIVKGPNGLTCVDAIDWLFVWID